MLEECDEPVPLAERCARAGAEKLEESVILPDKLELASHSDIFPASQAPPPHRPPT